MDAASIVKRVRAQSGVTRKELAELADVSPSTVGRIERGSLDPTWGTLSRILDATGNRISGETVVSAGDPTAIAAARRVIEPIFASPDALRAAGASSGPRDEWIGRWRRAGWLSEKRDADDLVTLAVVAGNAAKISRRTVSRRVVAFDGGWRALARRLSDENIEYAVSGLIAAREDRATATSVSPVFYTPDPDRVVAELGLEEARFGISLIAPTGDELDHNQVEDGIRFVSRAQGVLDAFAGGGREPDKAEDALRSLLAATT